MSILRTLLLLPLVSACTVQLAVPPAAQVTCGDTADCPGESRCVAEVGLCSVPGVDDAVPPQLLELDLQPTVGTVGTVFTLRFKVNEPLLVEPVVIDSFEQRWVKQPESTALSYVYRYTAAFGVADGALSVSVRLVDHGGNLERKVAGSIVVDADGPDIYPSRLTIVSRPPGENDTIAGEPETTEAGATLELFSDLAFTERVWTQQADEEGGFEARSLGDNFTDQLTDTVSGQPWFWLRATDALGNHGPVARVSTDVTPPQVSVVSVERLATSPLDGASSWVEARTFRATPGQATARVRALITGQLVAMPRLLVGDVVDVPCALVDLSPEGGTYECDFAPPDGVTDGMPLEVVVHARSFGAGNVGAVSAGSISVDATLPSAPDAGKIDVVMSPVGEDDLLVLQAGAVEPGATVVVFETLTLQDQSGTRCELLTSATARADDTGALTLSLGDNEVGSFLVRQIDPAGNDPCPACFNGGCAASVPLANDIHGPSVQVLSTASAFTSDTDAQFTFQVAEQGPMQGDAMVVHPPVTLECWLDGVPLACTEDVELTRLSAARHTFEYRGTDALGNVSPTRSFEWTVQPVDRVLDAPLRELPTHRSYVIDEAGLGHLYVGGKALYAFHETALGSFTSEAIVADRPVVSVVAAREGSTTWVAWQHPGDRARAADVMLAHNDGSGWQTQVVTRVVSPVGELELTIDEGVPVLFVLRCRFSADSCFTSGANNNAFAVEAHRVVAGGTEVEPLPDTLFARGLRAVSDEQGTTWLLHAERPANVAVTLKLHERKAGVWQPAITIAGDGAPDMGSSNFALVPGLALGANGLPVASFSPALNQPVWSAAFTGTGFTFHNLNRQGEHVALTAPDGVIREVFSAWDLPVHDRSAAGVWSQSSLGYSHHPYSLTAAQQDDALHVVVGRLQNPRTPLDRVIEGGGTQELAPVDGYAGFAPMKGAAVPTLVVGAEATLQLKTFDGTDWKVAQTIRSLPAGMGHALSAVSQGEVAWVAHVEEPAGTLWMERREAGIWSTVGPLTGWGQMARHPQVVLRGDGAPVVVYQSSDRLYGTWWDGAAFVTPIELHALNGMYDLTNLALIGDHEGQTWAVFGDSNEQKVRAMRFDSTQAQPLDCEGCGLVDVAPVSGTPYVSAAVSPDGALQVLVSSVWQTFALFTWDDGAWSSSSLDGRFKGYRRGAPGEGWLPLENDCFAEGSVYPQETAAFGFDAAGRRLIQARVNCYRWSQGNGPVEMLAVETSPGEYAAYPLATSGDDGIEFMRAVVPAGEGAVVVWGDPSSATVSSFATSSL